MTAIPKRLTADSAGKLRSPDGSIKISYASPFPIPFSAGGITGQMHGVVLHTTGGFWQSAVDLFQSKSNQAGSAHFMVGGMEGEQHEGELIQFVPVGKGFETYHAFNANGEFYGIETTDNGTSGSGHAHVAPISDKGLWTWAATFEFLSSFAGFPAQILTRESGRGLGYHRQFFDWNHSGHTCPGATMTDMTRVNQRAEIVKRALAIRSGVQAHPRTPGHIAYAAHGDALQWGDGGTAIPFWAQLDRPNHAAWEAAAEAVRH
jgi:hypothetical protein